MSLVTEVFRTEKGKRQRTPDLWRPGELGGRTWWRREPAASALKREGGVVSETFHPFSETKKIISPISLAEINDKLSIP